MTIPSFFKKKRFWAILVILCVIGGFAYAKSNAPKGPFYDTQPVTRGAIVQTVEVTGEIVPRARIDLSFKNGGKITSLSATVGATVKKGDILAAVDSTEAQLAVRRAASTVSLALANLRSREAGETVESIRIAEANLEQAKANYQKAQQDLEATKRSVEDDVNLASIAKETAQRNLDNALNTNDQTVENGYSSLRASLQNAIGPIQTGLADGDLLVGIDNRSELYRYSQTFGAGDSASLNGARSIYPSAKLARDLSFQKVRALSSLSTNAEIRDAAETVKDALEKTQRYLDFVQRALTATVASSNFTATEIATKKSLIDGDRASVGSQLAAVTSALQLATGNELARTTSIDQLRQALTTAEANIRSAETARANRIAAAESAISIQAAAVTSAQASLNQRKAPPRAVDLAALRAQLQDAQTAYTQATERLADTQIIAPVDGVVTEVGPKIGEQVMAGARAIGLIGGDAFTIEALIPESDIAKVSSGQTVTIVLDAFGDAQPFKGTVLAEYPDQTKIQDAVYYKAIISIDTDGKDVKPGMTADLTILTAERPSSTLSIPTRAIRSFNDTRVVQILVNGAAEDRSVETGLRADEARLEVLSGLTEGELVIVGELTAVEYAARVKQEAAE